MTGARYDANAAIVRTSHLDSESMDAFVAEAYAPMSEKWESVKQKVAQGIGTPEEKLMVESEHRLKLIYDILSKDIVEAVGIFSSSSMEPVKGFSRRISGETGISPDFVYRYLSLWVEKNYLGYTVNNGFFSMDVAGKSCR